MNANTPLMLRWTIRLLSVLLFFLFLWLQGFVVGDIHDIEGPDRSEIEDQAVDGQLVRRSSSLQAQQGELGREIQRQEEIKANRRETMSVAQQTWNQIAQEHRRELDAGRQPSEDLAVTLEEAQDRYLQATATFEEANNTVGSLQQQLHALALEREQIEADLKPQRRKAGQAFDDQYERHRWKLASLKLAFVVPLFLLAAWLVAKRRESLLQPIFKALLVSSFCWLVLVMFEHFPADLFKYIAIAAAIFIVLGFLIRSLRSTARFEEAKKSVSSLLRRRREAYQANRCPECAFPIPEETGGAMSCASCGVALYSPCSECGTVRHELLPHCRHCGLETHRWHEVGPQAGA